MIVRTLNHKKAPDAVEFKGLPTREVVRYAREQGQGCLNRIFGNRLTAIQRLHLKKSTTLEIDDGTITRYQKGSV